MRVRDGICHSSSEGQSGGFCVKETSWIHFVVLKQDDVSIFSSLFASGNGRKKWKKAVLIMEKRFDVNLGGKGRLGLM